jgi:hypothetical protein
MRISLSGLIDKLTAKTSVKKAEAGSVRNLPEIQLPSRQPPTRPPHHVQIGFDFGTAFSKVVVRDVNAKTARVFLPASPEQDQLPFLIPSVLYFGVDESGKAWFCSKRWHPSNEELRFPKLALCGISGNEIARKNVLQAYERCAQTAGCRIDLFIEDAVTFYMASVLSNIVLNLRNGEMRLFSNPDDWLGVCVAVPAENLNDTTLGRRFERCLRRAFVQATTGGSEPIYSAGVSEIGHQWHEPGTNQVDPYQCMLYPEVSANMVAYTQSRSSSEGLFQMIDVGAGTVDVSFFTFVRNREGPRLANFSGLVSFCGSSRIERDACERLRYSLDRVSELREKKEGIASSARNEEHVLDLVRTEIGEEVANVVHRSIIDMLPKLPNRNQMGETRFLFVGGGNCRNPYQDHTLGKWSQLGRTQNGAVNIPFPPDLEAPGNRAGWFQRLTVAYGLSFDPANRPETTLPGDHNGPPPVNRGPRNAPSAPSKDEC